MNTIRKMGALEWVLLFVLSCLWGGSFFFIEVALTGLPIFTIVFLRVCIAAVILTVYLSIRKIRLPSGGGVWKSLIVLGVLNNVIPFCMIVWGQSSITGGMASILNATTPFFAVIAAHLFTKDEKLNLYKGTGVLLSFAGVLILIGYKAFGGQENQIPGQAAVLAAALSYSLGGVWGRRFKSMNIKPVVISAGQFICSSILLLPVMLLHDKPWTLPMPGWSVWAAVLGIASLSTALAYIIYFRILGVSGATNVLLVTFLIPLSAILLGVLFLGETLEPQHFAGMAVIGLGFLFIDGRFLPPLRVRNRVKKEVS